MQFKHIFYKDRVYLSLDAKTVYCFKQVLGNYILDKPHARRDQFLAYSILKQLSDLGLVVDGLIKPQEERLLLLAAFYHDIGWSIKKKGNGPHAELSRELILEKRAELEKVLSKKDVYSIAFIMAQHGTTDILQDQYFLGRSKLRQSKLALLSAVLRLADVLDREPAVSVSSVELVYGPQCRELLLVLRDKQQDFLLPQRAFGSNYQEFIEKYVEKVSLLQNILGIPIVLAQHE